MPRVNSSPALFLHCLRKTPTTYGPFPPIQKVRDKHGVARCLSDGSTSDVQGQIYTHPILKTCYNAAKDQMWELSAPLPTVGQCCKCSLQVWVGGVNVTLGVGHRQVLT